MYNRKVVFTIETETNIPEAELRKRGDLRLIHKDRRLFITQIQVNVIQPPKGVKT